MKTNSLREAPYDRRTGNLLHYAYRSIWHEADSTVEWRPNDPMELRLTIDGVTSGRSAKYVTWVTLAPYVPGEPTRSLTFPMFVVDLVEMLRDGAPVINGTVHAMFRVRKRGQNYGLTYDGSVPEATA